MLQEIQNVNFKRLVQIGLLGKSNVCVITYWKEDLIISLLSNTGLIFRTIWNTGTRFYMIDRSQYAVANDESYILIYVYRNNPNVLFACC